MKTKKLDLNKKTAQPKQTPSPQKEIVVEEEKPKALDRKVNINLKSTPKQKQSIIKTKLQALRSRKFLKRLAIFSTILIVFGILLYFAVIAPGLRIKKSADSILDAFNDLSTDMDAKDLSRLNSYTDKITSNLDDISKEIDNFTYLRDLPFTRGYYDNLKVVQRMTDKTKSLVEVTFPRLEPILSAAGYKTTSDDTPEVVKDDEQISALLKQLPDLLDLYEEVEPQILDLLSEFNNLNTDYIPNVGNYEFKSYIGSAQELTVDLPTISEDIKAALRVLPDLLGVGKTANFLIIFQNEKEMRSSGGLITAFGNLQVKNGEFGDDIEAKDMWVLNDDLANWGIHPPIYNKNGQLFLMTANNNRCGGSLTRPQDSGVYPDQHQTIQTFRRYYDVAANHWKLKNTYPKYQHVILMNTLFASELISFVDPIKIKSFESPITADNMARALTYHLNTDAALGKVELENRKNFIKDLATEVKNRISALSVKDLPAILSSFLKETQARHVSFFSTDKDIQAYFDEMGMSGRITTADKFKGDYFHHAEAQYCALKSNFYVTDDVDMVVEIKPDGKIIKTVNVEWQNARFSEDTPHFIINPTGRFPYAVWSRMFVPQGSTYLNSNSYSRSSYFYYHPKQYYDKEVGAYVLDHVIHFSHARKKGEDVKKKDYSTQYQLPKSLNFNKDKGYSLLLVKHAGKRSEQVTITVKQSGKTKLKTVNLYRDLLVTWKDDEFTVEPYDKKLDKFVDYSISLNRFFSDSSEYKGANYGFKKPAKS